MPLVEEQLAAGLQTSPVFGPDNPELATARAAYEQVVLPQVASGEDLFVSERSWSRHMQRWHDGCATKGLEQQPGCVQDNGTVADVEAIITCSEELRRRPGLSLAAADQS